MRVSAPAIADPPLVLLLLLLLLLLLPSFRIFSSSSSDIATLCLTDAAPVLLSDEAEEDGAAHSKMSDTKQWRITRSTDACADGRHEPPVVAGPPSACIRRCCSRSRPERRMPGRGGTPPPN